MKRILPCLTRSKYKGPSLSKDQEADLEHLCEGEGCYSIEELQRDPGDKVSVRQHGEDVKSGKLLLNMNRKTKEVVGKLGWDNSKAPSGKWMTRVTLSIQEPENPQEESDDFKSRRYTLTSWGEFSVAERVSLTLIVTHVPVEYTGAFQNSRILRLFDNEDKSKILIGIQTTADEIEWRKKLRPLILFKSSRSKTIQDLAMLMPGYNASLCPDDRELGKYYDQCGMSDGLSSQNLAPTWLSPEVDRRYQDGVLFPTRKLEVFDKEPETINGQSAETEEMD